jgi:mono/diheme cytochrome c family protein
MRLALLVALAIAASPAAAADVSGPALAYALECQGCHQADGRGTPGSVPALSGSVARFLAVPGGREYLSQVPGVAQAPLDDATLAGVLNWMLTRFDEAHVPKDFVPYAAAEVGRLRKTPLTDVERVRGELLRVIERAR